MFLAFALNVPASLALAAPASPAAPSTAGSQDVELPILLDDETTAAKPAAFAPSASGTSTANPAAASSETGPRASSLTDRALGLAADFKRLALPGAAPLALESDNATTEGDSRIKSVLHKALALLGTPYRWGGTDPEKGFDCSGLVGYVFRNALGIELPRVSRDMAGNPNLGERITDRAKLAAGDLVFFGRKGRVNHVGIYVGEGRFVHAPSRGKDVTVSSLDKGYWSVRFLQARRVGF